MNQQTHRRSSLFTALIITTKKLGYKFKLVAGDGGEHLGYIKNNKTINLGRNQPLEDRVIVLAHELGHALDNIHDPPTVDEIWDILASEEAYKKSPKYLQREESAWKYGKKLLVSMGGFNLVRQRFARLRKRYLTEYQYNAENKLR